MMDRLDYNGILKQSLKLWLMAGIDLKSVIEWEFYVEWNGRFRFIIGLFEDKL